MSLDILIDDVSNNRNKFSSPAGVFKKFSFLFAPSNSKESPQLNVSDIHLKPAQAKRLNGSISVNMRFLWRKASGIKI
jgi:hypothetical protein